MLVLASADFVLFQPNRFFEPPYCIVSVYIVACPGQKKWHKCPNTATFGLFFLCDVPEWRECDVA